MRQWPSDFLDSIICGDFVSVAGDIPDNSVDLTVTSPPYDNLRDYKNYVFDFEAIARELFRITSKGGIIVWVVGDATIKGSESGTSFKQTLYFKHIGLNLHDTMIYQKGGLSYPSSNRYHQMFEYMFVFSKGKSRTFNPICDVRNRWGGSSTWAEKTQRGQDGTLIKVGKKVIKEYSMRGNIWKYLSGKGHGNQDEIAYQHPATFPEHLAEDHILSWSNPGDIILDPMCGSGTTCKMALLNQRRYIGVDIAEEYCDIARQRLALYKGG